MNDLTTLTDRKNVKISNDLNMARYSLSTVETNIIFKMITEIKMEDEDFKEYIFKVTDLNDKLGVKLNRNSLKNIAESIMSKPLKIKKEDNGFLVINWISSFEYVGKNGEIILSFDPKLKPYLLEMKEKFLTFDAGNLFKLSSSYSKRIYTMLKQNQFKGKHFFNVEELQDILIVPKSLIKWDNFKRRIIDPAVKSINEDTDLIIDYEITEKSGKKVIGIEFTIKQKEKENVDNFKDWFLSEYKDYKEEIITFKDMSITLEDKYFKSIGQFYKFTKNDINDIWVMLKMKEQFLKNNIENWKMWKASKSK